MTGRPDIGLNKKQHRRRRNRWNALVGLVGIVSASALMMAMWFLLYYVRTRICPANSFIVGSTSLASLLAIMPWFFVGLCAGCALTSLALNRLFPAQAVPVLGRSARQNSRRSMRLLNAITIGFLVPALVLFSIGGLTGFCAGADGISSRKSPWSDTDFYQWEEVRRVTVACYSSGRSQHASFTLSMNDGAEIDLYAIPRSFNSGYPSMHKALKNVQLIYDDSQVRADCTSTLHGLPPW